MKRRRDLVGKSTKNKINHIIKKKWKTFQSKFSHFSFLAAFLCENGLSLSGLLWATDFGRRRKVFMKSLNFDSK